MIDAYTRAATITFGWLAGRFTKTFEGLKPGLLGSGMGILLKSWISIMFFTTFLAYIISLIVTATLNIALAFDFIMFLYAVVLAPIMIAAFVFLLLYIYPSQKAKSLQKSIETDLPFALAHMSAIASSGIPPEFMFELLIGFEEYKAVSKQAQQIVRNIKNYGMSSVAAMNDVAKKTPSPAFKQILNGMASTIEKGGNLIEYLKEMSDKALFEYRMRREKYLKTLSTYADIYTALLVAAPLMMLAVLGVMSIIGGEILGMTIQDIINLITWAVLPFLNIAFLAFIHVTYPGV